ncbi:MAG: hypothetical protein ABFD94_18370, partial [Armatimonadia bacterium]
MKNACLGLCVAIALFTLTVAPKACAEGGFDPHKYLIRQKELPAPYRVHDEENRFPAYSWDDGHWYRGGKDPEGMTSKDFDYKFIHEEIWKGNNNTIQIEGAVFANPAVAALRMDDQQKATGAGEYKDVSLGGGRALYQVNPQGEWPRYYIHIGNVFGYVYGGVKAYDDTLAIAKLWVAKLMGRATDQTQPKPPPTTTAAPKDLPDLHVQSDRFVLTMAGDNTVLDLEPAADKQSVAVQIENRSQKVPAANAYMQLYVASPAGSTPQPVGKQLALPTIPAGGTIAVGTTWDLGGQNQVDVELWVKVYIPNTDDANPDDNQASLKCSIRYAHNGRRAFSWFDDTYRFVNFGYQDRETEELVEGVVATILGNLQEAPDVRKAWQKLTFAAIYQRVEAYMNKSINAGAGGHCYGMAATAGLYFEGTAAPPLGKATPALTLEEASTNINVYHRAQMLPVLRALSGTGDYLQRDFSPQHCYNDVRNALEFSRLSPILEFFGRDPGDKTTIIGHAVLAYKLIEVEGRDPVIYIYDPNYPASAVKAPHPMPQISLRIAQNTWANPTYMGYDWAIGTWISARRVAREISLDMVNALGPQLKAMAYTAVNALSQGKQMMAILRCPADVCFTDAQGRRTGMVNGKLINEIPGAEPGSVGEVEMYLLPLGQNYSVTVTGTDAGTMSLDLLQAPTAEQLTAASFERVPVKKGGQLTGTLTGTGQLANLKSGSQTYPVQWSGSANLAAFNPGDGTSTPPPTTTTPPVQPKPPTPPTQPATANPPPVASTPTTATDPDRVVLARPQANQLVDTTIEVVGRARPQTTVVVYTIVYNAQNGQMISTIPGIRAKTKDNGELAWVIA